MKLWAFMTGEYVTEESAAEGMAEEIGWVDPHYSRKTLFENRNYVNPMLETDTEAEELEDDVYSILGQIGVYEDNGDGTFYGVDTEKDYDTSGHYRYDIHFVVKYYGKDGWTERPWHPSEAGIEV